MLRRTFLAVVVASLLGFMFPSEMRAGNNTIRITGMYNSGGILVINLAWGPAQWLDRVYAYDGVQGGNASATENPRYDSGVQTLYIFSGWSPGDPIYVQGWLNGTIVTQTSGTAPN